MLEPRRFGAMLGRHFERVRLGAAQMLIAAPSDFHQDWDYVRPIAKGGVSYEQLVLASAGRRPAIRAGDNKYPGASTREAGSHRLRRWLQLADLGGPGKGIIS